ncbi:hypothetical protein [Agrobacterium cavarae]|uniref:hypothetical protein n=1 Tax=Agrobacterium cavarae TaxID=2528239 RepID=UPI0013EF521C|nr:hypothetical protein [Agrobacterium cavarae]
MASLCPGDAIFPSAVCGQRGLNDRGALVILGLDPRIQVSIRWWMVGSSPTMTPERDTDTKL